MPDDTDTTPDTGTGADEHPGEVESTADRLHRATIEFGLDTAQAEAFQLLVDAATGDDATAVDATAVAAALDDRAVAEAAWTRWSDEDLLGGPLESLVASLDDDPSAGVAWLRSRHHAWFGRTEESITALEAARGVRPPSGPVRARGDRGRSW